MSRSLGAYVMGIYQVAFSVFIVAIAAVTSGIPLYVSTHTAKPLILGTRKEHTVLTSGLLLNCLLAVVCILAVLVFKPVLVNLFTDSLSHSILMVLLPAIVFTAAAEVFKSNMWGHKKYTLVSVLELSEQLLRIILCMFIMHLARDAFTKASLAALSLSVISGAGLIMVIVAYARQGGRYTTFGQSDALSVTKVAAPITLLRLISSTVNFVMAIILPMRLVAAGLTNAQALSAYGSSVGMSMGFIYTPLTLTGALSTALVPEMSAAAAAGHTATLRRRTEKALIFAAIAAAALVPVFGVIGNDIGMFIYNNQDAGIFLAKATVVMIPIAVEQISCSVLNAVGLERKGFINSMCGTALLIASIWFLPKYLGIDALIVGMSLNYLLSFTLNILCLRKHFGLTLNFLRPLLLNLVFLIPACSLVWGVDRLLYFLPAAPAILICAAMGVGAMVIFNICFSIIDISTFWITLKGDRVKSVK